MSRKSLIIVLLMFVAILGWGRGRPEEPMVSDDRLAFSLIDLVGSTVEFPGDAFEERVV